jgi:hypothetical protein
VRDQELAASPPVLTARGDTAPQRDALKRALDISSTGFDVWLTVGNPQVLGYVDLFNAVCS